MRTDYAPRFKAGPPALVVALVVIPGVRGLASQGRHETETGAIPATATAKRKHASTPSQSGALRARGYVSVPDLRSITDVVLRSNETFLTILRAVNLVNSTAANLLERFVETQKTAYSTLDTAETTAEKLANPGDAQSLTWLRTFRKKLQPVVLSYEARAHGAASGISYQLEPLVERAFITVSELSGQLSTAVSRVAELSADANDGALRQDSSIPFGWLAGMSSVKAAKFAVHAVNTSVSDTTSVLDVLNSTMIDLLTSNIDAEVEKDMIQLESIIAMALFEAQDFLPNRISTEIRSAFDRAYEVVGEISRAVQSTRTEVEGIVGDAKENLARCTVAASELSALVDLSQEVAKEGEE